ncbi:MAG: UbiD family decarboxylase [Candidatus Bathyarchaeia archaeon]
MNLRQYLNFLQTEHPDEILIIDQEVNPKFEITAILKSLEDMGKYPLVIFKNVKNLLGDKSNFTVLSNLFASRERCAWTLTSTIRDVASEYNKRESQPRKPVLINEDEAPVKEVILKDEKVDLRTLPLITHHEKDAGPYITGGVHIVRDDECGYNAATIRDMYKDSKTLVACFLKGRHTDIYHTKYEKAGKNMPIAIVIGHHPSFYLGAQTIQPITLDEYETIGGIMGEPLRLTPSTTFGKELLIPADAEIVLEGEVLGGVREAEGPFGEYPRTYGPENNDGRVIRIRAINMRKNAIYLDIYPGSRDHFLLGSIPVEGRILSTVKSIVPGTMNVHLPPSGSGRFLCYVQIRKLREGEGKNAIIAALSAYDVTKYVVVVDEDVDIFNEEEVLWAVATRSQWDRDLVIIAGARGASLDPSSAAGISARGGIDATKKMHPIATRAFPEKITIPQESLEKASSFLKELLKQK